MKRTYSGFNFNFQDMNCGFDVRVKDINIFFDKILHDLVHPNFDEFYCDKHGGRFEGD